MGICNPMETEETYLDTSISACSYLVQSFVEDGEISQYAHLANVLREVKGSRVMRDILNV